MRGAIAFMFIAGIVSGGILVNRSLEVDGLPRSYFLYVPDEALKLPPLFHRPKKIPVVFVLHGGGGNARSILKNTKGKFNTLADLYNFLVIYPNAVAGHWNDGRKIYPSQILGIDDVKFLLKIAEKLSWEFPVDLTKVFMTGLSNGAMMSYKVACEASQKIAAIAPVASPMNSSTHRHCHPWAPVSVMIIIGTEDPIIPWEGGEINFRGKYLGEVVSVEETFNFWGKTNGCIAEVERTYLPDVNTEDRTRVWKKEFKKCRAGKEVLLYGIEGGGHTWPGGDSILPQSIVGKISRDIDAAQLIWKFFSRQ